MPKLTLTYRNLIGLAYKYWAERRHEQGSLFCYCYTVLVNHFDVIMLIMFFEIQVYLSLKVDSEF